MIESQLDPALDGTGEGYGNYPGLTVAQVAERFRALADEGHNRSVRAILRIAREQIAARGTLNVQFYLLTIACVATVGLSVARLVMGNLGGKLDRYLLALLVVTFILGLGVISIRRSALQNRAQVREIRRLALAALEGVVENPAFAPKPLEREHLQTLNELRSVDRDAWTRVTSALRPRD